MKRFIPLIIVLASTFLFSCSSNIYTPVEELPPAENLKYSLVFYIHGDADYLYHDENNKSVNADEESVRQAIDVAKTLTNGEVFILHQKRKKHFLFFFPKDDKEFYYFRNGRLLTQLSLDTDENKGVLDDEISFIKKYAAVNHPDSSAAIFLYFGHQLPEKNEAGYFISFPEQEFGIELLSEKAAEVAEILNKKEFDITVLSTCVGGTPFVAQKFSKLTKFLIASPEDLHLSFMNIDYLKSLNNLGNFNPREFSLNFAESSFERLKKKTTTIVSVSVYDMNYLQPELSGLPDAPCSTLINSLADKKGVTVFYRPPQFGRRKDNNTHSGWNCAGE